MKMFGVGVSVSVVAKQVYRIYANIIFFSDEVLKYVEETNKSAAKHIKTEVQKAKLTTARQMRDYYLKCFKKSLKDHQYV